MSESTFKAMLSGFTDSDGTNTVSVKDAIARSKINESESESAAERLDKILENVNKSALSGAFNNAETKNVPKPKSVLNRPNASGNKLGAKSSVTEKEIVYVHTAVPQKLLHDYLNAFISVCRPDMDVVEANRTIATRNLVDFERQVSIETSYFIAMQFGLLISALVLDYNDFRKTLSGAISIEMNIDTFGEHHRRLIRDELNEEYDIEKTHCMEIGVTVFSDAVFQELSNSVLNSLKAIRGTKLEDDVNKSGESLSDEDKSYISYIISNYIYLIRAFNNNGKFFAEAVETVRSLANEYNIKITS